MRLPKTVSVNNVPFRVVKNRKNFGCSFSYKTGVMIISTKGTSRETLEGFLHEIAEVSTVERGVRAEKCKPGGGGKEYVFQGSHKDFTDVITDVSIIVADLMKLP